MQARSRDLLHGPLAGGIILYTIPIILTSCLQLLFNMTDLIVVGRFCGSVCVAAVGSTNAITNLVINLFMGLSVGAGVTVAHCLGAGAGEDVRRTVGTAYLTAFFGGLVLTAAGVPITPVLLRWMATPEDVLPLATVYMRICFGGMVFNMILNYAASMLRASGDTRSPLLVLTAAGFLNVVLNLIFVIFCGMDVDGVAYATVIAQAASACTLTWLLLHRKEDTRLEPGYLRFDSKSFLRMMKIGIPAGIQGAMFSVSNVIIQSAVNSFGSAVVSGNAAVSSLEGFCYVSVNGFHQAAVNYVGQNLGAHQYDRVRRIMKLCTAYALGIGFLVGGALTLFRRPLLALYITDSEEALNVAMERVLYTTLPYAVFGFLDVQSGILRGFEASMTAMLLSVCGVCGIRLLWIGTLFRLPGFHTIFGLFMVYLVSWMVTGAAEYIAVRIISRRMLTAQ